MGDFKTIGMVDIRGKANYSCAMRDDFTCEDGNATRCPYKGTMNCPSSQAEARAASSMLVTTNYSKWIASRKYGQGMDHFEQVVFDEAHSAPNAIASAMQVVLHHKEIEATLGMDFPKVSLTKKYELGNQIEAIKAFKVWGMDAKGEAEDQMAYTKQQIASSHDPKSSWVKHYNHMKNLVRRLSILVTCNPKNWVVDLTDEGYQFDPIRPGQYAEAVMLLKVPRIVAVSATLRKKTMYMMGIGEANFVFKEFGSTFDPNRCPLYYVPTMNVDSHATDLSPIWMLHDQIATQRQDRKGIDHTISFDRQDQILQYSRHFDRMIYNKRREPVGPKVEEFKVADPGAIFVSPSVGQGYDFPMAQCEWQFIPKVPFVDSRNKVVQARQDGDKEYGPYLAVQSLSQMPGRGMRSPEDQCENFIGDKHMGWFMKKWSYLFTQSFLNTIKEVRTLPVPKRRLIA